MSANRNNSKKLFISTVPDPFTSKISVILKVMKYRASLSKRKKIIGENEKMCAEDKVEKRGNKNDIENKIVEKNRKKKRRQ